MAEKEYIEREAVLEAAKKSHLYFDLKPIINSIPSADVRPVVLCRDCEYYQADCGWCGWFDIGMNVKDFCSWGKKREES